MTDKSSFDIWWEREGKFQAAATPADMRRIAEIAWQNGAFCLNLDAAAIIEDIGTTACGCENIGMYKAAQKWLREHGKNVEIQEYCGDCDPCIGGRRDQCAIFGKPIVRKGV